MFLRLETDFDKNQKNIRIKKLISHLNEDFPIDYSISSFEVYPFSNEDKYSAVLDKLSSKKTINFNSSIRVAILFGESNFLSMLPEISADLILLADIEPKLHQHNQHLYNCFNKSNSPDEFLQHYIIDNPIANFNTRFDEDTPVLTIPILTDMLSGKLGIVSKSLKQHHFLSSLERFNMCKKAASQLAFTHINLDLMDEIKCRKLGFLLKSSNAILTLCNLTNIHDYDNNSKLKTTVPLILNESPNCLIMYSTQFMPLRTNLTNAIEDYFAKSDIDDYDSKEEEQFDLRTCHDSRPNMYGLGY